MMADNIQDGLIILEKGKTIYANNRIAEITGYSFEELWAMDALATVAPESRENAIRQIHDIGEHPEKSGDIQMWIIRKDGERRFVYARISGVKHHDTFYNFIIFTDLTELESQCAKVGESEERFRMMADNIQDGIIIVENDKIVFSNRRFKDITGYSAEEVAKMDIHGALVLDDPVADAGIVPVTDKGMIEEIIRKVTPGSAPGEFRIWIRRKDGAHRYLQGKVTAAKHGDITSMYIITSDITDFAEREKSLRERINALQDLLH